MFFQTGSSQTREAEMTGFPCNGEEGNEEPPKCSVWPWCLLSRCSKKHYLDKLEAGIQWTKFYMYGKKQSKGLNHCGREERDKTMEFEKLRETAQPIRLHIFGHSKYVSLEISCIYMVLLHIQCDVET